MRNRAEWIAGGFGGALLLGAVAVLGFTHFQALFHPGLNQVASAQPNSNDILKFPTVDQMCKAAGAGAGQMESCVNDENSAAEFVGAWMQFNGFLTEGRIDIVQIQLAAELAAADPTIGAPAGDQVDPLSDPLSDIPPDAALGPDAADLLAPSASAGQISPAQIALLCLTEASDDWLKMHDCIAHNDPSATLDGAH